MKRLSLCLLLATFLATHRDPVQAASSLAPGTDSSCVRPDAEQFLEAARASIGYGHERYFPDRQAFFLTQNINGHDLRWMGIGWTGPIDGVLFVIDCAGRQMAHLRLGGIKELKEGPVTPVGPTAETTHVSTGTGIYTETVTLTLLLDDSIKIVWDHLTRDETTFLNFGVDYVDTYSWKITPDGKRITVTGQRAVGLVKDPDHGWAPGTTHALPDKYFCWGPREKRFNACK